MQQTRKPGPQRALVLAGGGAKGSYQVGVWQALQELGWTPDIITGASVGALNGCLFTMGKSKEAEDLWRGLEIHDVLEVPDSLKPEELNNFFLDVVRSGGLNVEPLAETIDRLIDEDAVRRSPIRFGLVMTELGTMRRVQCPVEKIPEGQMKDYLLGSSACFPALRPREIDGVKYIDGGWRDNMPLDLAAAMGADLPVTEPTGSMVVDIGGGTTEVAVISLGGIVTSSSLRLAGNKMDEAIAMYLRDLLGIKVGERTAEIIKIKIGSILPFEDGREKDMIISGQDVVTEQPREVTIQSEDVRAALQPPIEEMVVHIKETFKKTNPDLASDIISNGILLTGGGGLLSGLDRYLTSRLEIPVWTSETALTNVAMGCLKVLETPTALKQTLMRSK